MLKAEFDGGDAVVWTATDDGAEAEREPFAASLYVDGPDRAVADLRERLAADPKVADTGVERWFTSLRADERSEVLRVDVERVREVRQLAREVRHHHERGRHAPGTFRLYDVDLGPQFRYCLTTDEAPVPDDPASTLSTLSVGLGEKALADRDASALAIDGERVAGDEAAALEHLDARLAREDPDVLVVNHGDVVPALFERAGACGVDLRLGRRPGFEQLAGANTVESYGRVLHSPARYDVPGRVLVDRSSSFLWAKTNLRGLADLAGFAATPLQEIARASIGTVLTAIEIREARKRGVLAPWNKWTPERFKDARTLHAADRGGLTLSPEVGYHEDVVEVDFGSLYPRIMVSRNVSPDTLDCACHAGRADVPELGYAICDERGFIADVLEPLLDHRAAMKARIREGEREGRGASTRPGGDRPRGGDADAEARSEAIKWILVSCFGYQGYRNAKFGRIECHEAINAYAREILLDAKDAFEAAGWRVVHSIVDSVWLKPEEPDPEAAARVAARVGDGIGIPLEVEGTYDWICFAPRRGDRVADQRVAGGASASRSRRAGALTRYFGRFAGGEYKVRGIECRQRTTPAFVAEVQRDMLAAIDRRRSPEAVCDVLARAQRRLRAGEVPTADLVVRTRASKPADAYRQETTVVGALRRAADAGVEKHPGEDVRFVVVDDEAARPRQRVRLHFEAGDRYDADFYAASLLRAAESVASPFGWDRERIRRHLDDHENATLDAFG